MMTRNRPALHAVHYWRQCGRNRQGTRRVRVVSRARDRDDAPVSMPIDTVALYTDPARHYSASRSETGWKLVEMATLRFVAFIFCLISATVNAQAGDAKPPYTITPIFNQAMSDTGLAGYEMLAIRLDLLPGGADPTPHRHDADLFVYILQGSIEVELAGKKTTYSAGSMFHEPRNELHSLLQNTSGDQPASILAVFVIKSGREAVVPAAE